MDHNLPSVAVAGGETHEAVGKVIVVDEAAQLAALVRGAAHGLVVVADDSLGDQRGKVVIIVPANTLDSDSNVRGGNVVVAHTDLGADEAGLLLGEEVGGVMRGGSGEAVEVLLGKLYKFIVGNATSSDEDHAVGSVVGLDVAVEFGSGDVADVLARAEDSAAQGLVLVGGGMQVVEDDLVQLLLDLFRFPENDVALPFNSGGLELRVLEDIGEDVDALGDVGVEGS